MRSIRDILVFKTPFEDEETIKNKFNKIKEMFEDYVINAGIDLQKKDNSSQSYIIWEFVNNDFGINVSFSFKKDLKSRDYFPAIIVSYFLDDLKFEKKNIENFLNDNIKFIYNVFFDDFFVDFDKKFEINDINKGKKLELGDLKKFDMQNKNSPENKKLLDSMMYTYFNLIKNIFNIESNVSQIGNLIKGNSVSEQNILLFAQRQDMLKQKLAKNAIIIKNQIDAFVNMLS